MTKLGGVLEKYKNKYVVKLMPDLKNFPQNDKTQYIPCGKRAGLDHIYAISDSKLGLWLTGRGKIRRIMVQIKGLEIIQDGDDEAVLGFKPELLDEVAKFAKAKKRRHLSPEHKIKLVEAGLATRKYGSK